MSRTLVVPRRFNGPPASGNGGWTAGALASRLTGAAEGAEGAEGGAGAVGAAVRLSAPPPLDSAMEVRSAPDGAVEARWGSRLVLSARPLGAGDADALPVVDEVDPATAAAAAPAYRGLASHPFPTCFVCGPERAVGDGMRLTPGVPAGRPTDTACVWLPGADVDRPQVWAALDCPGGWSLDLVGRPMVLGGITAAVRRVPSPGEPCVVVGRALDDEAVPGRTVSGRTARTAASLWAGGELLGTAAHVWVAVDAAVFAALGAVL